MLGISTALVLMQGHQLGDLCLTDVKRRLAQIRGDGMSINAKPNAATFCDNEIALADTAGRLPVQRNNSRTLVARTWCARDVLRLNNLTKSVLLMEEL